VSFDADPPALEVSLLLNDQFGAAWPHPDLAAAVFEQQPAAEDRALID
jgi:hypothetical protein